jgi:hypothetical protein
VTDDLPQIVSRKDEVRQTIDDHINDIVALAVRMEAMPAFAERRDMLEPLLLARAAARCVRDSFRGDRPDVSAASLHRYVYDLQVGYVEAYPAPLLRRGHAYRVVSAARACQFLVFAANHALVALSRLVNYDGDLNLTMSRRELEYARREWEAALSTVRRT